MDPGCIWVDLAWIWVDLEWIWGGFVMDLDEVWVDPGWTWDGCGVALAALFGYSIDLYVMSRNT